MNDEMMCGYSKLFDDFILGKILLNVKRIMSLLAIFHA
jgi:hypothetical protein